MTDPFGNAYIPGAGVHVPPKGADWVEHTAGQDCLTHIESGRPFPGHIRPLRPSERAEAPEYEALREPERSEVGKLFDAMYRPTARTPERAVYEDDLPF